jgi:hypothetical protein
MFATLRYNSQDGEAEIIEDSHVFSEVGKALQHLACDNCRSKKACFPSSCAHIVCRYHM